MNKYSLRTHMVAHQNCNVVDPPTIQDKWSPPSLPPLTHEDGLQIFVDASNGDDDNDGLSSSTPLRTLHSALRLSRHVTQTTSGANPPQRHILVRGRHYLSSPLEMTSADSGLHIRLATDNGQPAELTGATRLKGIVWTPFTPKPTPPPAPTPPSFLPNTNNVYGDAKPHRDSPGMCFDVTL